MSIETHSPGLRRRVGNAIVFGGVRYPLPPAKAPPVKPRRDWILVATDDTRPPSVQHILAVVSRQCGFSAQQVASRQRNPNVTLVRHIWWYLAVKLAGLSLPQIAAAAGGRDHTSIMNARDRITSLCAGDSLFAAKVSALEIAVRSEPQR
jgi:hypothetical protein